MKRRRARERMAASRVSRLAVSESSRPEGGTAQRNRPSGGASAPRAALSRLPPMRHLVTLCTGNAARSVMAGAILADHVPALVVETRGTHVVEGMPMSWRTRDAIVGVGARAEGHRSRQVSSADLADADLVLAMAREHVEYVRRRHPEAAAR